MKDECHGDLAFLFSYPQSYLWGNHFHEPGGIHLNLPSSFTYYCTTTRQECQVFFQVFLEWLQGWESNPLKQGYEPRPDTDLPCDLVGDIGIEPMTFCV